MLNQKLSDGNFTTYGDCKRSIIMPVMNMYVMFNLSTIDVEAALLEILLLGVCHGEEYTRAYSHRNG